MSSTVAARISLAADHLRRGQLAQAEVELNGVLTRDPGNVTARFLLAVLEFRAGKLPLSERILNELVSAHPNYLDAVGMLAVVKRSTGQVAGALHLFERAISLGQRTPDIYNQIGSCLLELDDPVAAGAAFKQAIELDRTDAQSYYNLGLALKSVGRSYETYMTFRRSAELNPDSLDTYEQIWQQMRQLLNWNDGIGLIEQGHIRNPQSTRLMALLASTYGKVGRKAEAEAMFLKARALDPGVNLTYAHWLQEEGRFEDSIPVFKDDVRSRPIQGQAYYNLSTAKCFEIDGRGFAEIIPPLLEEAAIGQEGRMFLHYALANWADSRKDYSVAYQHFDAANELAYHLYNSKFDHDSFAADVEHAVLLKLYSSATISDQQNNGSQSSMPIFIVGMIRTGTTLLDQILAAHPDVGSAGEQPYWQVSAGRVNRQWLESGAASDEIHRLADEYLAILKQVSPSTPRVTDKMPTNFIHVGLMSVVFPKAKFIHIRRSPLDTCTSIYTTFLGSGTQFAYSKSNIVAYYREYLRTMEHWRQVLPEGQMIEIDYEDLVANEPEVLRDLLQFLDLTWNESVLRHDQNIGQVSTPSLWTARQPVNTSSVERWRRYEPWLGELLELGSVVHPPATTRPGHRLAHS